jgi:FkbM family methyltransferase
LDLDFIVAKEIVRNFFPLDFGVLDIGCHEGAFTQHLLGERDSYNAIMIDPLPEKIEIVNRKFPGANIFQCAISDEEKAADFFVTIDFPKCSALYDREAYDQIPALNKREKITVKMKRLDSVLSEISFEENKSEGWYLKIDTEGYEMEAFKSLGRFIDDKKILAGHFEYGGTWKERGLKLDEMLSLLKDSGFVTLKCFQYQQSYGLTRIDSFSDDYEFENIYFVRKNIIENAESKIQNSESK